MRTIDADALIEKYGGWYTEEGDESGFIGTIEDIVNTMPVIVPERKKGEWIDKSGGIEGVWNYCSVCGEQAIDLYDYCPNCGADMREEGEQKWKG